MECRLVGTVVRTFRERDTCVIYLASRDTGHTYGLIEASSGPEDARCRYTRAFEGRGSVPFIWTRFADTETVPRAQQTAIRSRDRGAHATTFYALVGDLHGDIFGPGDARDAIAAAMDFSEGGDPGLTRTVRVELVEPEARSEVRAASREIDERRVPGTDYRAETVAIYEVYETRARDRVVGYAVYGRGSGEPDYQDAIVIGFDLQGTRVFSEVEVL